MAAPLPLPPSGVAIFDPTTGGISPQWQNYFQQLAIAIGTLGAAPADAFYLVSQPDGSLTNQVNLGGLVSGVLEIAVLAGIATVSSAALVQLTRGGTAADLSLTGGANQIVQQSVAGAALNVGTFAASQLSDYSTGTWTPADGSGAALALTVTTATFAKVGSLVFVEADLTYPVTVDGSNSRISGLPFTSIAAKYPLATGGNFGSAYEATVNATATTVDFLSVAGVRIINSALSTKQVQFSGCYRT